MRESTPFLRPAIVAFVIATSAIATTTVGGPIATVQASPTAGAANDPAIGTASPRVWPRSIRRGDAVLVLQRPQLDLWKGDRLTTSIATSIDPGLGRPEVTGIVVLRMNVLANGATGEATLYNFELDHADFGDDTLSDTVDELVRNAVPRAPVTMPIARLTGLIDDHTVIDVEQEPLSQDPPVIIYRETPTVLLMLPDRIKRRAIASGITLVADADRPLFEVSGAYYLFDGVGWLQTLDLEQGDWEDCRSLPAAFARIPDEPRFAHLREAVSTLDDATEASASDVPEVVRSPVPAELVVVDGAPTWNRVERTPLLRAMNTDSDLFLDTDDTTFYLLVSGRWFTASSPSGDWSMIDADDVPKPFATIPAGDAAHRVVASVPGTLASKEALAMAQTPEIAAIDRDAATLAVVYDGAPKFQPITGTPMQYAVNSETAVIRVQGRFFALEHAVWFKASKATGPWQVAIEIPDVVYTIPPESPLYYVTFVRIYDVDQGTVVTGCTAGYSGVYVSGSVVVYGTGYYYPYYYWPRWYWGRPPVWGYNRWYDASTGRYVASRNYYGPSGRAVGYGWANPSTGWSGRGYQARDPYAQWGRNVATNGRTWVSTAHVSDARGTVAAGRTSEGNRGVASNRGGDGWNATARYDGNRYVGADGSVYRRDDDGWKRYQDGGWVPATAGATNRARFDSVRGGLDASHRARTRSVNRSAPNRTVRRTTPSRSFARPGGGGRGGFRGR
ncbi:MAG: hypothetical protein CMJ27_10920 [Phycisphaerae bacterium]|nr:hypothetical protein [Phycisphaerae bacterium]OUX00656.1 MAG: hypothetical protein CBD91_06215 [Phycisphaeraceae bacterium TMED231]